MAHQSEQAKRLEIVTEQIRSLRAARQVRPLPGDVLLVIPPFGRSLGRATGSGDYHDCLRALSSGADASRVVCILTTPQDAAETWPVLDDRLKFHLWVAVKLRTPVPNERALPARHAALLVLTKYRGALRHTKTRIAYSYCPACDKTTKDYGGKKHTYHHYGTLMSDVWRDVAWDIRRCPSELVERLADLFGLSPHKRLRVLDLRGVRSLRPGPASSAERVTGPITPETVNTAGPSALRRGDCLDELRQIPDNSIDFCFADPPYNLEKTYDSWTDDLDIRNYFQWCDRWLEQLVRVLKPGRTCAVLNIPLWAIRHFQFLKTGLRFQNWIAWEGLGLPVRMIMPSHYSILCFSKGPARVPPGIARAWHSPLERQSLHCMKESFCARPACMDRRRALGTEDLEPISDLWWDIHRLKHNARRADHPCQLPPALMRRLIACFTSAGEVVLDPFNGVGTTTLCAEQLNRGFVGIELSEKYHGIARERHEMLRLGGDPFAKRSGVPQAKNSRVRRIGGQRYAVAKKTLQLEVRAIARELGRLPTRDEVARMSRYPISYFDEYFIGWGEVCAAARTTGMSEEREIAATSSAGLLPLE